MRHTSREDALVAALPKSLTEQDRAEKVATYTQGGGLVVLASKKYCVQERICLSQIDNPDTIGERVEAMLLKVATASGNS